jgi:pyrroloquinoline-quinone synthase
MGSIFSEIIEEHHLLKHPFYLAWNEGKLTRKQLALYSCEYGTFIRQISKGWQIVGEHKIAAEEIEHFRLWEKFSDSICPQMISAKLKTSIQLLWTTEENLKKYPSALGALYAFEAQQPATTKSKLEGIRKYYTHWKISETYFEKHVDDWQEPALLEEKIDQLNEKERMIASEACSSECIALWDALSGIMAASMN